MAAETTDSYPFTPTKRSVFSPQNLNNKKAKPNINLKNVNSVRKIPASKSGRRG